MYIVTGPGKRKQFDTLKEAVSFKGDNPLLDIFADDGFGNVDKVPADKIRQANQELATQEDPAQDKKTTQSGIDSNLSQIEKKVQHTYGLDTHEDPKSRNFKLALIIFMIIVLMYIAYRLVGHDLMGILRGIV